MDLIEKIRKNELGDIDFQEVIAYIDEHFDFTPTAFKNGDLYNEANQNNGSCKIFSYARWVELSKEKTLALFGAYYRKEVLESPDGNDHQNIRNFMKYGWEGIEFEQEALSEK